MSHHDQVGPQKKKKGKKESLPENLEQLGQLILKTKNGPSTPEAILELLKNLNDLLVISKIKKNNTVSVNWDWKDSKDEKNAERSLRDFIKQFPTDIINIEENITSIMAAAKPSKPTGPFFEQANNLSQVADNVKKTSLSLAGIVITSTKNLRLILGTFAIITEPPTALKDVDLKTAIKMLKAVGINPKQLSDLLKLYKAGKEIFADPEKYLSVENIALFAVVMMALAITLQIYRHVKSYCEDNHVDLDNEQAADLLEELKTNVHTPQPKNKKI